MEEDWLMAAAIIPNVKEQEKKSEEENVSQQSGEYLAGSQSSQQPPGKAVNPEAAPNACSLEQNSLISAIPDEATQKASDSYEPEGFSASTKTTLRQEAASEIRASIEAKALPSPDRNRSYRQRVPLESDNRFVSPLQSPRCLQRERDGRSASPARSPVNYKGKLLEWDGKFYETHSYLSADWIDDDEAWKIE